jgi:TonB-like protein
MSNLGVSDDTRTNRCYITYCGSAFLPNCPSFLTLDSPFAVAVPEHCVELRSSAHPPQPRSTVLLRHGLRKTGYPREARLAHTEGKVKLILVIAADGSIADLQAVSGEKPQRLP